MPTQVTITAMLKDDRAAEDFTDAFNEWTGEGGLSELFTLTRNTPSGELEIDYKIDFEHIDSYGRLNAAWDGSSPRFVIYDSPGAEPNDEDGWRYKLTLVDHKYTDSDALPITTHPHGNTRAEAYACASDFIDRATSVEHCIF